MQCSKNSGFHSRRRDRAIGKSIDTMGRLRKHSLSRDRAAIGDLFQVPQPRLFLADVVPGSRNCVELLSKLDLEHHQAAVTEPGFAGGQIEFPHSAEPIAEDCSCFRAVEKKTLAP